MKRLPQRSRITVIMLMDVAISVLILWEPFPVFTVVGTLVGLTGLYAFLTSRLRFSGRTLRVIPAPSVPLPTTRSTDIPLYLISTLVTRNVTEWAFRVMLLSFVQRGFIILDPDGNEYVILYLPDDPTLDDPIEQLTWRLLRQHADANQELDALALERVRLTFRRVVPPVIMALFAQKGWLDPRVTAYSARVGRVTISGILLWLPFLATCVPTHSLWGVLCFGLIVALQLDLARQTLPATTPDAEAIASPWRDFQRHLLQAHRYPDAYSVIPSLDTSDQMLLDMLAVGNEDLPAEWYHLAAEQHYRPRWLGPQWAGYGFADVWTRFIATLTLQSEGGGGA